MAEIAVVEKPPTMEGRFMNMILGPSRASRQEQKNATAEPKTRAAAEPKAPAAPEPKAPAAAEG